MIKTFKSAFLILVITMSILFLSHNIQAKSSTTKPNDTGSISVKITNLIIHLDSWSLLFNATISVNNSYSTSITLKQVNSCGFQITSYAITDFNASPMQGQINCPGFKAGNSFVSITYKPGITTENIYGYMSFLFNYQSTNLPPGFYYFDIDMSFNYPYTIDPIDALFVNYGNNSNSVEYNVTNPDTAPYGTLPISDQLSIFAGSAPISTSESISSANESRSVTSNVSTLNEFTYLILGLLIIIISFSSFSYLGYKKRLKKKILNPNKNLDLNIGTEFNKTQINKLESHENVCPYCKSPFMESDLFCMNCGNKLI